MSTNRPVEPGKFWRRVAGHSIYHYFNLVNRTAKYETTGIENITKADATGRPLIWITWHGLNMPFMMWLVAHRPDKKCTVVAIGDRRFDVLEVLANRFGATAVPIDMKGNPMAAAKGVQKVLKGLRNGDESFLCPDAEGPAFVPKKGVFYLAKKADAVLVPFGIWTQQAKLQDRWDHNMFPYPFADMKAVVGEPFAVSDEPDDESLRERVIRTLNETRHDAQVAAGVTPWP